MTGNNESPEPVRGKAASDHESAEQDVMADGDPHTSDSSSFSGGPQDGVTPEAVSDDDDPLGFGDQRMNSGEGAGEHFVDVDEEYGVETDDFDAEELAAKLEKAEAKASEHWERLVRMQAEMENQRKRSQNEVTKARKFALEGIVGDLLPVKDSLEMGLAAATAEDVDPKAIVEGAELTLKMLAQVFEKHQILEVNPVDEKFDPEFHQAMSMQEVEGKEPNTVTNVMQKGYTLNDRLVRPALVMVAK